LQSIVTIPEIVWEAFLGLWLTFKGFSPAPITSSDVAPVGVDGTLPASRAAAV
jgi:hypothetical protein